MTDQQERLKNLYKQRGSFKSQLTLFAKFLSKLNDKFDLSGADFQNLEQRVIKITPIYDTFCGIQGEIEILCDEDDKNMQERESFQDTYFESTCLAAEILSKNRRQDGQSIQSQTIANQSLSQSVNNQTNNQIQSSQLSNDPSLQSNSNKQRIKLPTINLPSFDGAFTLWREFYDAFSTLIHNNEDLNAVQKLTYLRASLKGEPAGLLRSLDTTEANYEIAWSLLKKRYDNKRRIVSNHVQALLEIPSMFKESHVTLRQLINLTQNHIQCLKSLGQPVDQWDALLIPIISSKLDMQTVKDWEAKLNNEGNLNNIPEFETFLDFLNCRQNTLETIIQKKSAENIKPNNHLANKHIKTFTTVNQINTCDYCKQNHYLQHCEAFLKLDVTERNQKAKEFKLCLNCLRKNHFIHNCRSKTNCRHCNKRHHSILHYYRTNENNQQGVSCVSKEVQSETIQSVSMSTTAVDIPSHTLLSTAVIQVSNVKNEFINLRVLLDSASQSHFISEHACQLLNLKKYPVDLNVTGINQGMCKITQKVTITIKSRINNFTCNITCFVLPQITQALPAQTLNIKEFKVPPNIKLADPFFYKSQTVDILIGASLFYDLLCVGQIKEPHMPIFQKTKFGWIASGSIVNQQLSNSNVSYLSVNQLDQRVEQFWKTDEFISNNKPRSAEEQFCETYFNETTTRDRHGKFVVKLPFNEKIKNLGNSYAVAESQFLALEKRLSRDDHLKDLYSNFISEYINLKHMTKVNFDEKQSFFLPHHPVVKENKETTKLRVVFNGSCKTSNGFSINEAQCTGPTIQDDVFAIIARFRTHPFVVIADVEKMYRQVWVHPEHRQYQRILWRNNQNDELSCYELNTVTYGTTAAPFLAIRSLMQVAYDNENKYPQVAQIIKNDFYVDDVLTGANTIQELRTIKNDLINILQSAGFPLRKFTSNVQELCDKDSTISEISLGDKIKKPLGVSWNPLNDTFCYSASNITIHKQITKRTILATTAQLYDPLGLLAPIIVTAKLLVQQLWQLKLNWDESVPMNIQTKWLLFCDKLNHINTLTTVLILYELVMKCQLLENFFKRIIILL